MFAGPDQSLACAYAALILHDDGKSIDAGAIDKMLVAAGCKAGTEGDVSVDWNVVFESRANLVWTCCSLPLREGAFRC